MFYDFSIQQQSRADLTPQPGGEYLWSSAATHTCGHDDRLAKASPLLELVDDWGVMSGQIAERDVSLLRSHEGTGRSLHGESFIDGLERTLGRWLRKQKPVPKPNPRSR